MVVVVCLQVRVDLLVHATAWWQETARIWVYCVVVTRAHLVLAIGSHEHLKLFLVEVAVTAGRAIVEVKAIVQVLIVIVVTLAKLVIIVAAVASVSLAVRVFSVHTVRRRVVVKVFLLLEVAIDAAIKFTDPPGHLTALLLLLLLLEHLAPPSLQLLLSLLPLQDYLVLVFQDLIEEYFHGFVAE